LPSPKFEEVSNTRTRLVWSKVDPRPTPVNTQKDRMKMALLVLTHGAEGTYINPIIFITHKSEPGLIEMAE
jgi:hypothetical protein